jgi:hypothetical protein
MFRVTKRHTLAIFFFFGQFHLSTRGGNEAIKNVPTRMKLYENEKVFSVFNNHIYYAHWEIVIEIL